MWTNEALKIFILRHLGIAWKASLPIYWADIGLLFNVIQACQYYYLM